jgi:hypothetical protein
MHKRPEEPTASNKGRPANKNCVLNNGQLNGVNSPQKGKGAGGRIGRQSESRVDWAWVSIWSSHASSSVSH